MIVFGGGGVGGRGGEWGYHIGREHKQRDQESMSNIVDWNKRT